MHYLLLILLALLASPLAADDYFKLSGFGTLGMVDIDSENYGYRRDISHDDGSFESDWRWQTTSVLGLQPEVQFNDEFDLVTQFIYRDQNEFELDSATSLAFVRFSPDANWSLRLGRTAIDLFQFTEYLDVGFAYPWAKVPTEVYGMIPYRYLDGADFTYSTPLGNTILRAKFFAGTSKTDFAAYENPEEVKVDNLFGVTTELEAINWMLKFNLTHAKFDEEIPVIDMLLDRVRACATLGGCFAGGLPNVPLWENADAFAEDASISNKKVIYGSINGRYEWNNWTVYAEYLQANVDSSLVPTLHNGYVSFVYNYKDHAFFTTYARTKAKQYEFDEPLTLQPPFDTNPGVLGAIQGLQAGIELGANFFSANQRSVSVGWRWNLSENLALKTQIESTKIEDLGGTLWLNRDKPLGPWPGEVIHTYYTNLSFTF